MSHTWFRFLRFLGWALLSLCLVTACQGNFSADTPQNCRAIAHVKGETCVPQTPKRVVVLHDYLGLDAVLALGVQPVGAVGTVGSSSPFPPWLAEKTQGVELVGTPQQPNLEKIVTLQPDLIITLENEGHQEIYRELSQIAPTVIIPSQRELFPELTFLGKVLGQPEKAQALQDRYQQRLQEFRDAMGEERLQELEVSLVRFLPDGVRIEGTSYNVGKILQDAGLKRPPEQQIERPLQVSLEQIEMIDGDVMFANTIANPQLQSAANQTLQRYKQHPLWSKLKAVQRDRVYEVDPYLWSGNGILWSYEIIEELFQYLVET
ncbi:MAG: iron-siderophore ABC transporter substrate-binding protein [Kamptonema sp. SIO4C4]|nr:iron-siderophore ABC transporter substrate-binding protein [Kamptonema sp. SIO4C4]